jgi:RNA polymerase sigma-70 factor (ECF subfamily)
MKTSQYTLSQVRPLMKSHQVEALFEDLFLRHYELVYRVLCRLLGDEAEAEDMSQRVFLKLYHNMDRIQAQKDETKVTGWLYRVAVNEGYNALRARRRRASWYEKFARLWPFAQSPPDPAQVIETQDTQAQVRGILADMNPRDAELLLMRHAGLSYRELAAALKVAPGSVGPLLTQARRIFARKYRRTFPDMEE